MVASFRVSRTLLAGLALVVVVVPQLAGRVAQAGTNQWTSTGPDGGWVSSVAWHPTHDGVLFAGAGRVYRSLDSGAHWTAVSTGLTAQGSFVFDPNNGDRILLAAQPVLRSTDGGASFLPTPLLPDAANVSLLAITANGSAVFATSGGRVYRSTDFAQTWQEMSTGLPAA